MGLKSDNSDAYTLVYFLAFLSLFPGFKPACGIYVLHGFLFRKTYPTPTSTFISLIVGFRTSCTFLLKQLLQFHFLFKYVII